MSWRQQSRMFVAVMLYRYFFQSERYLFDTLLSTEDQNAMYADDSKSEIGVGFAAVRRLQLAIFLRQPRSSLQLHVIFAIVKMTRDLRNYSIVIYCNSRSALQAIKSLHSSHPVAREAHDWLEVMSARKNCWVQRLVSKGRSELTGGPRQLPLSPGMLALLSHTPPWHPAPEVGGSNGSRPLERNREIRNDLWQLNDLRPSRRASRGCVNKA